MKIFIMLLFVFGTNVYSHGENQLGPHKGYVRMPGAFHTELVPLSDTKFKLYLLDVRWKNPSVENSKLSMVILDKELAGAVSCNKEKKYYTCELPDGYSLKSGKITVKSSYKNLPGIEVSYILPLGLISNH